ncbi:MAG: leucyl/phenylalanyl-tRNA--protein transferase [Phycisphaerae bacterium]
MRENELTADRVVHGYCSGYFPMGQDDGEIAWYSPDPRCIFEFERFHVPRSLRQTVRQGRFEIRVNSAFAEVMRACAERPDEGTWITQPIFDVYRELHRAGLAHSLEAWQDGQLVGGLYGVTIGAAYFGESMFHRARDASKVALVFLIERLAQRGYVLVDTQWRTQHLSRFGVVEIGRDEYLSRLSKAIRLPRAFDDRVTANCAGPALRSNAEQERSG